MRTMRTLWSAVVCAICFAAAFPAEASPPAFTAKPTATRGADGVRIDFAVDRQTDVAVFIEDSAGKVVRHLVAGVLGDNPPAPLKPGLAQSVQWDGLADYGKPAGPGPFKVRVALGLGAKYDKVLLSALTASTGSRTAGVGPDGTLYLPKSSNTFGGSGILAFNRDGSYQRTVSPFPASMSADRVKGLEVFELDGRPAPLPHNQVHGLYPQPAWGSRKHQLPISSDGKIYLVGGQPGKYNKYGLSTGVIRTDGSCPDDALAVALKMPVGVGPVIPDIYFMGLALSGDEKTLYVSGLNTRKGVVPVVFRIPLPQRDSLEVFFGDAAAAGKSETQLSQPRGLAIDGKGRLLIADRGNDRIVVINEADGKYVGEVATSKPDFIAVDRGTGHIYVTSPLAAKNTYRLQKLSGWKDGKVLAEIELKWIGHGNCPPAMALDATAQPPVIWLQEDYGRLMRVEDLGDSFGKAALVSDDADSSTGFMDICVDRLRNEVYMRGCGRVNGSMLWWYRYDESADKMERFNVGPFTSSSGAQLVPGPDGTLYAPAYTSGIFKFTRDGKPSPWENPIRPTGAEASRPGAKMAHCTYMPVSECWMRHVLGVRQDGHIFAFQPSRNGGRPTRMLREYLPSGQLAREEPIIWKVSDGSIGPKFDAQGNIYIAEICKPADQIYPPEFVKALGPIDPEKDRLDWGSAKDSAANIYGSIIKFSPKGGLVDINVTYGGVKSDNPYKGEPKLDPSLKTAEYVYHDGAGRMATVKVTGAEWVRMGCSQVFIGQCTCDSTRFDVDEFGRVWYPDQGRFRICVLDTNGNSLTEFGGYGNADSCGPDSAVVDPQTGKLRPRRQSDPASLRSPLAEPEIAFAWLTGVGVTDRYIYTGDGLNRRMMRSRINYAAEESCDIK